MINKKYFWSDLSISDFQKTNFENYVAILPIAAVEQHGPHLPVNVDFKIIDGLINLLAKKLNKKNKILFLPTQKIGKSNEHLEFPGTLSLSSDTLTSILLEIGDCVRKTGIKKLVLFNSHGGNSSLLDVIAREIRVKNKMLVFNFSWFNFGLPNDLYSDEETKYGIHAGDIETSMMLALDPANVDMSKAENFVSEISKIDKKFKHIALNSSAKIAWQTQDLNTKGACGNAKLATAEKGKITLEFVCEKLLQVFDEIEQFPNEFISD